MEKNEKPTSEEKIKAMMTMSEMSRQLTDLRKQLARRGERV